MSRVRRLFSRRTHALILGGFLNVGFLVLIGLINSFVVALVLFAVWALIFAFEAPLRQAFINGLIPSEQRATVLSFDALLGSAGGVVAQPALGRTADVFGYPASYVVSGGRPGAGHPVRVPRPPRERVLRPDHGRTSADPRRRRSPSSLARQRHRPIGPEQERRQVRRDVRERQHVRVEVDPEDVAHERPARLDPRPRVRVAGRQLVAQRLVGERDPVLDVGREVRRRRSPG